MGDLAGGEWRETCKRGGSAYRSAGAAGGWSRGSVPLAVSERVATAVFLRGCPRACVRRPHFRFPPPAHFNPHFNHPLPPISSPHPPPYIPPGAHPPPPPPPSMAANPDPAAQALAATLSNSDSARHHAESVLASLAHDDPAHAAHLLRLAAGSDPLVAAAAALRLKNLVRMSRSSPRIPDDARRLVRANLLPALASARASSVEGVLAETTRWLVLLDFPARWPSLLNDVSEYLASPDPPRVHAALVALRQTVKCYEFKSRDPNKLLATDPNDVGLQHPRQPLDEIAAFFFPTLLALYRNLDAVIAKPPHPADPSSRVNAAHAQRLIVKIFWSCTQFILPPCMGDVDTLNSWMAAFLETFRRPTLHPYIDDPDDVNEEPEWKTKKWIATVLTRFLKRYGSPKKVPIDEPWTKQVAQVFKDRHAEKATTAMLEVLSAETKGQQLSQRVAHLALDFIEEAIETAALWGVIHPHIDTLLARVVFPYLCFSSNDEETWMNDPSEYVRKQYDFNEDFTSPRMAASNLLTKMSDLRSKSTILPFLQYLLQNVLVPFQGAPVGSPQRATLARQKVGAFASLAAVKAKLMSKKDLSDSFLNVLKTHVEPDLRVEFGFLRAQSAWLLGQIAARGWNEFSVSLGEASLRGCVSLLEDPELPVQAAAAGALQFLMDQEGSSTLISGVAPQLLQRLLHLMDNMSDGYASLLPAVDKLVVRYPDEIMPLTLPLVQRLMEAFRQSAQAIILEGDDDDDEMAFASAQVLNLISSIITGFGDWRHPTREEKSSLLQSVEIELQPLLNSMFEESHQVFVEELLDILGSLIMQTGELNGKLSPFLLSLIPRMVHGFHDWAADYAEHMMEAVTGYLRFDLPSVISLDGGTNAFVAMIKRLWSENFDDSDANFGSRIADMLILNLNKLQPLSSELIQQVIVELARGAAERCVKTAQDQTALRQRLFSIVMLSTYVDAGNVLESLGPLSVMQLIGSQSNDLQLFDRIHSKKSLILGIGSILCTRGVINDESKPHLLNLALRLQHMIDEQRNTNCQAGEQATESLVALSKDTNGTSPFAFAAINDQGSDLEDDQDATNIADDLNDGEEGGLERLAARTGLSVETLEQLNTNGAIEHGFFDLDAYAEEDDDEGTFDSHPLDDIDEVKFLVRSVKESTTDNSWWGKVPEQDKNAMEKLAIRMQ